MRISFCASLAGAALLAALSIRAQAAVTDDVNCEAARLKLAAIYSSCTLKAEAAALLKSATPDFAKCIQKFDDKCAAVDAKYGSACSSAESCSSIRDTAQCGSDALPVSSGGGGDPVTVTALTAEHMYFAGVENHRSVDVPVAFPDASSSYGSIVMHFALGCPQPGGCDFFDRRGSVSIVENPGGAEIPIEISRFVTPYRVGASWDVDVTDLRPILTGARTLRLFIDTWVGPGSPNGEGWLADVSFDFVPGTPARKAIAVLPVFQPQDLVYGDPAQPIPGQLAAAAVTVPGGASSLALRSLVTGHGQGNADNCGEFCSKQHTFTVDGTATSQNVWRSDCTTTAAPNQQGTWQYARAGWCAGAVVNPWSFDMPVPGDNTVNVGYDVEAYENTCRPDAPVCMGCTLGTGCAYDGGAHTEPVYNVSTVLIAYE